MTGTKEHFAKEAHRLLNDEVLAGAFERVRMDALIALGAVDPDNKTEILRLQATANCLQSVRDALFAAILANGDQNGGISVETRPTA